MLENQTPWKQGPSPSRKGWVNMQILNDIIRKYSSIAAQGFGDFIQSQ